MSTAIGNRIAKLEAEILPKQLPKFKLLYEPAPGADADKWDAYKADVADARNSGVQVVVVAGCHKPDREDLPGMRFFNSQWEADIHVLASQPSQLGNKNAFEDLLKSLPGAVLGVTANVPADIYQRTAMLDQ